MVSVRDFVAAHSGPVIGVLDGETDGLRYALPEAGYLVREVRGAKMPTVARLYDEFAAAFQFPAYFGENKDAFDECMRDLDDFLVDRAGEVAGYVVVVRDADELLRDQPRELAWFVEAMAFYAEHWRAREVGFAVVLSGAIEVDTKLARLTP